MLLQPCVTQQAHQSDNPLPAGVTAGLCLGVPLHISTEPSVRRVVIHSSQIQGTAMLGPHPGSQLHSYRLTSRAAHPRSDTVINTVDRDFPRVLRSRYHLSLRTPITDH